MQTRKFSYNLINKIAQEAVEQFTAILQTGAADWPGTPWPGGDEDPDNPSLGWGIPGVVLDNERPLIA